MDEKENNLSKKLSELIEGMDIPESRQTDYSWLRRNLGIRNKDHKNFKEVSQLLKEIR